LVSRYPYAVLPWVLILCVTPWLPVVTYPTCVLNCCSDCCSQIVGESEFPADQKQKIITRIALILQGKVPLVPPTTAAAPAQAAAPSAAPLPASGSAVTATPEQAPPVVPSGSGSVVAAVADAPAPPSSWSTTVIEQASVSAPQPEEVKAAAVTDASLAPIAAESTCPVDATHEPAHKRSRPDAD
jgi:hypothetical protein